jgi:hypothetical protein
MSEVARFAAMLGFALACAAPLALAAASLPVALAKPDAEVQALIPGLESLAVWRHEPDAAAINGAYATRCMLAAGVRTMRALLVRGGAVWQLVGLITRRSQVQILPPLPQFLV